MDKTIVKESAAATAFQWIVAAAAAVVFILIAYLAMDGNLSAELVLWSSASIVVTSSAGLLLYIIAAMSGATDY